MDIALKKVLDNSNSIRFFISPRILANFEEAKQGNMKSEIDKASYTLGIGADYLWILLKNGDMQMFGGSGIALSYEYKKTTHTYTDQEESMTYITKTTETTPYIGIGARGILGLNGK